MADSKKRRVIYRRSSSPTLPASMPSYVWSELGKIETAFNKLYAELDERLKTMEAKLGIDQNT